MRQAAHEVVTYEHQLCSAARQGRKGNKGRSRATTKKQHGSLEEGGTARRLGKAGTGETKRLEVEGRSLTRPFALVSRPPGGPHRTSIVEPSHSNPATGTAWHIPRRRMFIDARKTAAPGDWARSSLGGRLGRNCRCAASNPSNLCAGCPGPLMRRLRPSPVLV